nr:prolyl oligopeptidase family serine peptidase [Microlunatus panaciterrae]
MALANDGTLLVSVAQLDHKQTGYTSAWWKVDAQGRQPARRYTRSVEGEAAAAFLSDGSLLFTSKRPVPATGEEDGGDAGVIWCLPAGGGEAYVVARRDGGWQGIVTARDAELALFAAAVHAGVEDEKADAKKRALRKKKKVSAILHEGYPVRFWDHDLGPEEQRLFAVDLTASRVDGDGDFAPTADQLRNLIPDAGRGIGSAGSLSAAGDVLVLDWQTARSRGEVVSSVIAVDVATGERTVLAEDDNYEFVGAVVSADGGLVACSRETPSTPDRAPDQQLWLIERASGEGRLLAENWDRWATPVTFSPDGRTLYVTVDEDGHGPIYAVDVATGGRRRLTEEGTFGSVVMSADGATLYAVRSSYLDPGTVVAIGTAGGELTELRAPTDYPELPGRLEDVETVAADGARVRGYLLLPERASAEAPAPLALWIHGGPLGSWNAWSWRWCPWLLVSRGYAVLLPDPALSTGYGRDFVQRGWGAWGAAPYTDLMAITDEAEKRADIDETRTAAMGGSFGGYMANWVAGHTDRFDAIVTHASLWNLESFGPTTDASWYWAREMTPTMQQANSPHRFADRISTPMLVIHGDKDYRVPISEGLALWWALVSGHDGDPRELPHKFLYFPDENHWILTPQHSIVWYETVLSFMESTVLGGNFVRAETL